MRPLSDQGLWVLLQYKYLMIKHAYLPPKIWQHPYRDIIKLSVQPYAERFRRTNVHAGSRMIREDSERQVAVFAPSSTARFLTNRTLH